ncbi:MAG TPA: hypothetical protein VFF08_08085 [Trueperaceae bacterium]|nr:hypothetical protein [Trueperaceae bacterium]
MNLLASLPVWVLWAVLGITFVVVHAMAFQPRQEPGGGRMLKRVLSSVLLLVGLVLVDPAEPASVLLALLAAGVGGFLSGRAAPPVPSR